MLHVMKLGHLVPKLLVRAARVVVEGAVREEELSDGVLEAGLLGVWEAVFGALEDFVDDRQTVKDCQYVPVVGRRGVVQVAEDARQNGH